MNAREKIALTFQVMINVDVEDWAFEWGVSKDEVGADASAYFAERLGYHPSVEEFTEVTVVEA